MLTQSMLLETSASTSMISAQLYYVCGESVALLCSSPPVTYFVIRYRRLFPIAGRFAHSYDTSKGNFVLVRLPAYVQSRLQSVLNAAARMVYRLRRYDHISDALALGCEYLRIPGHIGATDRPCGDGCGIATAFGVEETGAGWVVLVVTVAIRGRPTTFEEPSCSDRRDSSTLSTLTAQE